MATKKKAARKAAPKKKSSISLTKKEQFLVKTITEAVSKNLLLNNIAGGAASNFSYSFELNGCKVTNFIVGHSINENPADTGSFYSPIMDPSIPPKIHVVVVAIQNFPACTGTLTLKYLGKDVFNGPKQILFTGGMGSINEIVNLPL